MSEKEKLILARHPEMEIPFLYQVKRSVLKPRGLLDFDGETCPDVIAQLRYDRKFVCFLEFFFVKKCFLFVLPLPYLVNPEKSGHAELKRLSKLDGDMFDGIREDGAEFAMPELE